MKQTALRLIRIVFFLSLSLRASTSQGKAAELPDFSRIGAFIESEVRANRIPGVAAAITHEGRIAYLCGMGQAGPGRKMRPDTPLYIGSVSKSFTALAVMQLVEGGRIVLDAPARNYLPWFEVSDSQASEKITIRDLLNQVSGLAGADFEGHVARNATIEEFVHSLRHAHTVQPVGAIFRYSNANYRILGLIIEKVSGKSFGEYLEENIFRPLQMVHTRVSPEGKDLAQGYIPVLSFPVAFSQRYVPYAAPSGYIISTAEDMAHFLIAQECQGQYGETRILSPQGIELMHRPRTDLKGPYAMGWYRESRDGIYLIRHSGDLDTFHADAVLLPEQKYGLILLYNESGLLPEGFVFPHIWEGVVRLLIGHNPGNKLSLVKFSLILAFTIAICLFVEVRSLISLPRWREQMRGLPTQRRVSIAAWSLTFPALPLVCLPALYAVSTGHALGDFFLRAPDVIGCLILWSMLGLVKGGARTWMIVRLARHTPHSPVPPSHTSK